MWNHPASIEYIGSLAVAGRDGTLRDRMTDSPAADDVRAKTGTLANASALSGYVTTKSGRALAFSCLFDNTPRKGWRYRDVQDELVIRLAEIAR
jgi:D-alanyl-D-alanine carboxypeptidase